MQLADLPEEQLGELCLDETEKSRLSQQNDMSVCYELLRRALAAFSDQALSWVIRIYRRQVRNWVLSVDLYNSADEELEYFISGAFQRWTQYCSGEQFSAFPTVPALLQYLKECTGTYVLVYLRKKRLKTVSYDLAANTAYDEQNRVEAQIVKQDIWRSVLAALPNEQDRLLVDLVYRQGLKTEAIHQDYAHLWPSARAVTVAKQRIHNILRKNHTLRDLLRLQDETSAEPLSSDDNSV